MEAEKFTLLKDTLPRFSSEVQEAAFARMLQSGSSQALDFSGDALAPSALGRYLCVTYSKSSTAMSLPPKPP